MNYHEMMSILNEMRFSRFMAKEVDKIGKAADELKMLDGQFIEKTILDHYSGKISNPSNGELVTEAKEMLNSTCPFEDAKQGVEGVREFLSDIVHGQWTQDDLTVGQRQYYKIIRRWFNNWTTKRNSA